MEITNSGRVSLVKIEYVIVLLAVAFFCLAGSSSAVVPNGQVKGIIVDQKGHPFPRNEVDVFLATILDDATDKIKLNTSWKSPLDDSGEFLIKDVPPGKYCVVLFFKQKGNFAVVLKEDKLFAFEMPQDDGIDLGRVDASQVRFP